MLFEGKEAKNNWGNNTNSEDGLGSKVKTIIKDADIKYIVQKNKRSLIFWIGLLVSIIFVYFVFSSGEFSFILVISAMVQCASFFTIAMNVHSKQNAAGLSLNTMICYLLITTSRLSSTMFYSGYLPSDSAGDWFYQLCELGSLVFVIINMYFITKVYSELDASDNKDDMDYKYFAVPAAILALLVHTHLNGNILTDVAWSFSMYLEGFALLPQLNLFNNRKGQIESFTSNYVFLQGLHRLLTLIFWWQTYEELNDESDSSFSFFHTYTGYFILFAQIIQLIIMADFYYHYFKSLFKGEKMTISEI